MSRYDELVEIVNNDNLIPLIKQMVFLEEQLESLRKLPMIRVHPTDESKQKTTPAAKLYREYLQQYTNVVKVFLSVTTSAEGENEESPLRAWFTKHMDGRQ